MKFDFNTSMYARLFSNSDSRYLQTFIDDAALLEVNYGWWKTQAKKADQITPTANDGTATFTQKMRKVEVAPIMDLRSRLSDGTPMDTEGMESYSATIPDFIAPVFNETALERQYKEKLFAEFGNDSDVVMQYVDKVQTLYDSANATLTYHTAQLISTGKIKHDAGRGAHLPLLNVPIPTANFKKAGKATWAEPGCKLLDQMAKIEYDFRNQTGYSAVMVWKIPYDMFHNVFMKNAQVIQWIKDNRTYNNQATTDGMVFPEADVLRYISMYPGLSRIEIVKDKVRNLKNDSDTMVSGWLSKNAVLCPAGYVADIQHTDNLEVSLTKEYGSNAVVKTFATLEEGLFVLCNVTRNNGDYKEWETKLFGANIPSLNEWMYHCIVDTQTANEG